MDGSGPANDFDSHIRLNKDVLMSSLWKLNVVDIEMTLLHVCQMVLQERNIRKEDMKARASGLKILGKLFQGGKVSQEEGTSKKKTLAEMNDEESDSDSSVEEVSSRMLSYKTPMLSQGIGRLFKCLCNPEVDDNEIVYRGK